MLEKIVDLLKKNKTYTITEIANELGVSAEKVRVSLEYLEQTGYLKKNPYGDCTKKCESCKGCSLSLLKKNFENTWSSNQSS